jgi:glycosyltransferase involved in cell wall biosynthesis
MTLRFSIVVPTFNRWPMLQTALASVEAQQWPDVEIIVVDGGSHDATLAELASRPDIRLIPGPDRGVYDAFNKGIAAAGGDVVGILNSDDCYEPGSFAAAAAAFADDAAAVCGTALVVENNRIVSTFDREADKRVASPRTALIGSCSINARFFRRLPMQQLGPFDLAYKYVSDRDWLTRWYEARFKTIPIANVVYRYQQHPGSLTFDADRVRELAIREELIELARAWRTAMEASAGTKHVATMLEGRCRAYLAIRAAGEGRPADVKRWLVDDDGYASIRPIAAIIRSGPDWFIETLKRRWSVADQPT